jgi:7-cyano-7-deazaguanine synthase
MTKYDSVAICSGGLDSSTLVYHMVDNGLRPHLLSFDYGQRHVKELEYAANLAERLDLKWNRIDLSGITQLISNSALTSQDKTSHPEIPARHRAIEVPDGHYAEETMKATVVPNRNMIMLSIAIGVAVSNNYQEIGIGVHGGDHFIYPDCRPNFISHMNRVAELGNLGFGPYEEVKEPEWGAMPYGLINAPFLNWTKADIAYRALELNLPLFETWSCYKGGEIHCGRCGTCVERLEAIDEAIKRHEERDRDFIDYTRYQDTEFWKTAVKDA